MGFMTRQIAALTLGRKQIARLKPWLKKLPSSTGAEEGKFGRKNAVCSPPTSAGGNCLCRVAFHHTQRTKGLERVDIHLVQMNALTRQRIDMNARGVCS